MDQPKTIAYQGVPGAYSESACLHLFGTGCRTLPCERFEDVYEAVLDGRADGGAVPVENTTTGSIHPNYDLLMKYPVHIVGEVKLLIEHCLLAPKGVGIGDLTGLKSHPQALAQCSDFFAAHPGIAAIPEFDTAGSAQIVAREKGTTGAIASALAAEEYGLDILKKNLENQPGVNITRFFAIAKEPLADASAGTKCTIVYTPGGNRAGLLHKALSSFAVRNLDLLKIESRPRPGRPWEYIFHLDFRGNAATAAVAQTFEELRLEGGEVRLLGCYPEGSTRKLFSSRGVVPELP
ncbi:MAG: prephenate dehydratase [Fibrobacterales bacterium]|nr:prephenate dehydratase [Fibrobacterales bacterium]